MSEVLVPATPAGSALALNEQGMARLVELFLQGLRSKRTQLAYAEDLRLWAAWQGVPVAVAVEQLLRASAGEAHLQVFAYKAALLERKLAPATVNRRLAAIRSLVRMARIVGLVLWTLEIKGELVEAPIRDTRGPGVPAVRRLLRAAAKQKDPGKATRDVALLRLLYDLALRRAEVIAVDVADVDLERSALWVQRKGRGQKTLLSLPEATRKALAAWLELRGTRPGALFRNFDRAGDGVTGLSGHGLYAVVKDLSARAKIERTRPHGLRHTAITRAMEEAGRLGIPIEEVLAYSGHAKRSLPILLTYRDNVANRQGQLAGAVANGAHTPAAPTEG